MKQNKYSRPLAAGILSGLIMAQSFLALPVMAEAPFDIVVPQYTAMKTDLSNATPVPAYKDGQGLIKSAYATDTVGVAYGEAIARVSALGIMPRQGQMTFRPGENITGYEVIEALVNWQEGQGPTMGLVYNQVGSNYSQADIERVKRENYQQAALRLGIITGEDLIYLKGPVTKEQSGLWVSRSLNLPVENAISAVFSFSDWVESNPQYRNTLEALIKAKVMPLNNDGSLGPKTLMQRGEFAQLIENGLLNVRPAAGVSSQFGLVLNKEKRTTYSNGATVNETLYTVKRMDGTIDQLVTKSYPGQFNTEDFVVYKKGKVSNSNYLEVGDQMEYLIQNGQVIYAEILEKGQMLAELSDQLKADVAYGVMHFGQVSEIINEKIVKETTVILRDRLRVADYNGNTFDLIVDEDMNTGFRQDITTFKDSNVGGVKLLEKGDQIAYLINEKQEVVYIRAGQMTNEALSGTIRTVVPSKFDGDQTTGTYMPAQVSIFGYDDALKSYPVAPYASISVNQRVADLKDLVYGMHVKANVSNGYIVSIDGESYTDDPGYIPKYGKMRMGKVERIYNDGFYLMRPDGKKEFYKNSPSTEVSKGGNLISYQGIRMGDDVKLYFNDIYTDAIAKIEVEPQAKVFKQIYKGNLAGVNEVKGEITLTSPEYLKNEDWTPDKAYTKTIKIDKFSDIFIGNQPVRFDQLERQALGKDVYAVISDNYGQDKALKLTVKTGGESIRSTNVYKIDHTLNEMEIQTKENYNLTSGTIVIKDGRVVPASALNRRDDILLVGETTRGGSFTNETNALVVKVVTQYDDIFDQIRIGILEDVNPGSVSFIYHAKIDGNKFNEVNPNETKAKRFYSKSLIKDVTDPKNEIIIKPHEFFDKDYARVENESKDGKGLPYEGYYSFMVVNPEDESIIAMNLRKKGLLASQNIDDTVTKYSDVSEKLNKTFDDAKFTRGVVTEIDTTWHRIKLTDAHDYAEYTGQWTPTKTDIYADYQDAIMLENNTARSIDNVKVGDYLYIMRIKDEALVIFIE